LGNSVDEGFKFVDSSDNVRMVILKDGNVGIGTAVPSSLLDLEKVGTAKANLDILELTNSGNAADMDTTRTAILWNQWYYDATTPAVANACRMAVGTSTDWTSTASTQDAYFTLDLARDGTLTRVLKIDDAGLLTLSGAATISGTLGVTGAITGNLTGNASGSSGSCTGNSATATASTNLSGGLGGSIPYQSAANTTAMLANGTAGQVLKSNGTTLAPSWTSAGTGDLKADGTVPLTANWDVGAFTIQGTQFISDIAIGTAPFVVTSTTAVANLKAATVGTITGLAPDTATTQAAQPNITSLGTIASLVATTADINAGTFDGVVGGTTPAAGSFTTISASGLITATGGQIAFPATAVPSANANTLDDYEEGTWTPDLQFGGAKVGITYTATLGGYYTKIGRTVHLNGVFGLTSKGSSTGSATIAGLPFSTISGAGGRSAATIGYDYQVSFANQIMAHTEASASIINLNEVTEAGALTNITNVDFTNDSLIMLQITYTY